MPQRPLSHPLALERLADSRLPSGDIDPVAAAIAIASHHTPTLKPDLLRATLDSLARDVSHFLKHQNPLHAAVNHILFDRHAFFGNREHYSDPQNSYIDCVLQRKTGLPIVLSLIWVETARRAGGCAHGIGLPGHFVAAVDLPPRDGGRVYLDPFRRGALLSIDECHQVSLAAGVAWHDEFLQPVTGQQWAVRMLNNLRNAYTELRDPANTAAVLEQLLLLDPRNAVRQRELQALYKRLDHHISQNN